ncbi:MAG: hypothetical protein Q8K17_02310, partial [Pseudohongiella sp.]|nr:hypothetical protein [Pseudohongiella sp.]
MNTLSMLGAMALSYVLFATVSSADQNADMPDYSIQPTPLERLRAELTESLETSGAYNYGLLEPLNNLTAALIEDESYA